MIRTECSIIRTCNDDHLDVARGPVDIRFTFDEYKCRGTLSLTFGKIMIYADADEFVKLLKEKRVI